MAPAAQSNQPYDWKASLEDARSAFVRKDKAKAASALFDALGGAAQMARQCYDELLEYSPGPVPPEDSKIGLTSWPNLMITYGMYLRHASISSERTAEDACRRHLRIYGMPRFLLCLP